MAHKTVIVSRLGRYTSRNLPVFMIFGTNPGGEIVKEPLVVSYDAPLLLDGFPLVVHAKGTAINQDARHIESR